MCKPQLHQPRPTTHRRSSPPTSDNRLIPVRIRSQISKPHHRAPQHRITAQTALPPVGYPRSLSFAKLFNSPNNTNDRLDSLLAPTMNTPGASMPPAAGPGNADNYIIGKNTRPANPTPLSAPQEQQVRDLYYKNVRAKCAVEIEGMQFIYAVLVIRSLLC